MHIISASRRSDIPAFHARWFAESLGKGTARVRNPFSKQVYQVSLRPEDVLAIVFWTRNPLPLFRHGWDQVQALGIPACFQFTITGYDEDVEQSTPPTKVSLEAFGRAADEVGPEFVQWRYDPIVETGRMNWDWHLSNFESLARALEGHTHRCYFSFVQLYRKTRLRMEQAAGSAGFDYRFRGIRPAETRQSQRGRVYEPEEMLERARQLASIARAHGITLHTCCDDALVDPGSGIEKAHCVDLTIIRKLVGKPALEKASKPTREDCGCVESRDIGAYDSCAFGCVYCYAVSDPGKAAAVVRQSNEGTTQ